MTQSIFPGPIAPENNPPINPQYYQPSRFQISNISLGITTTITTTENNNYVIGQLVRLLIPYSSGCRGLNEQTGIVFSIPAPDQVVINLNSVGQNPFITSPVVQTTPPQIVAVGDYNSGPTNASRKNNQ